MCPFQHQQNSNNEKSLSNFFLNFFSFVNILDVVYFIVLTVSHIVFMIGKAVNDKMKIYGRDHGLIAVFVWMD